MSVELLKLSIAGFTSQLDATPDADWHLPTKCEGWNVRDLVHHVVGGAEMSTSAIRGAAVEELVANFQNFSLSGDPRADYAIAVERQLAAFAEAEANGEMDKVVQHPAMPMSAAQLLGFRIGDFALHSWDLGAAMGRTVVIDPRVCEHVWNALAPMAPMISSVGVFGSGPSGKVPDGADLQTRLLDLSGRRP